MSRKKRPPKHRYPLIASQPPAPHEQARLLHVLAKLLHQVADELHRLAGG